MENHGSRYLTRSRSRGRSQPPPSAVSNVPLNAPAGDPFQSEHDDNQQLAHDSSPLSPSSLNMAPMPRRSNSIAPESPSRYLNFPPSEPASPTETLLSKRYANTLPLPLGHNGTTHQHILMPLPARLTALTSGPSQTRGPQKAYRLQTKSSLATNADPTIAVTSFTLPANGRISRQNVRISRTPRHSPIPEGPSHRPQYLSLDHDEASASTEGKRIIYLL